MCIKMSWQTLCSIERLDYSYNFSHLRNFSRQGRRAPRQGVRKVLIDDCHHHHFPPWYSCEALQISMNMWQCTNMQDLMGPQIPAILYLVDLESDSQQRTPSVLHKVYMRNRPGSLRSPMFSEVVLALAPYPVLVRRYMRWFRGSAQAIVEEMSQKDADWEEKQEIGFMHLLQIAISDQSLPIDGLLRYCQSWSISLEYTSIFQHGMVYRPSQAISVILSPFSWLWATDTAI